MVTLSSHSEDAGVTVASSALELVAVLVKWLEKAPIRSRQTFILKRTVVRPGGPAHAASLGGRGCARDVGGSAAKLRELNFKVVGETHVRVESGTGRLHC